MVLCVFHIRFVVHLLINNQDGIHDHDMPCFQSRVFSFVLVIVVKIFLVLKMIGSIVLYEMNFYVHLEFTVLSFFLHRIIYVLERLGFDKLLLLFSALVGIIYFSHHVS